VTAEPVTADLIVRIDGKAGRLSLDRPGALHALTLGMCHDMTAALTGWATDDRVELVLIDHATGRGFCAGGDIRVLAESAATDGVEARRFFHDEYQLDHQLFTYPKPVVSFLDGVTMGGGVGISQPARFRVATDNTRFAMPETGIGLFPDVGGGWYLSRLPGRAGVFLGLTGARMTGADCLVLGLATHYLPAAALADVKAELAAHPADVAAILDRWSAAPPAAPIEALQPGIDRLFAADTLEGILAVLDADGGPWAGQQAAVLRTKSPLSCKVALRQLSLASAMTDFAEVMRMEYRIARHLLAGRDFAEGVRAVIVDKDNAPCWNPSTPEGVTDALLDRIFAPLAPDDEWKPL
jgi:enoyl-CoA hydratase